MLCGLLNHTEHVDLSLLLHRLLEVEFVVLGYLRLLIVIGLLLWLPEIVIVLLLHWLLEIEFVGLSWLLLVHHNWGLHLLIRVRLLHLHSRRLSDHGFGERLLLDRGCRHRKHIIGGLWLLLCKHVVGGRWLLLCKHVVGGCLLLLNRG